MTEPVEVAPVWSTGHGHRARGHIARMTKVEIDSGWLFPSKTGGLRSESVLDKPLRKTRRIPRIKKSIILIAPRIGRIRGLLP